VHRRLDHEYAGEAARRLGVASYESLSQVGIVQSCFQKVFVPGGGRKKKMGGEENGGNQKWGWELLVLCTQCVAPPILFPNGVWVGLLLGFFVVFL